ncbi:hypothetical protein [Robbsia andropogonis]|uniref:hypothetical protein n=1 Tax=Robbsia andropogonis TaxID=28092 RepID=UPI0012FAD6F5|nr:hypothetical protein [Robbsia andropogonis]
MAALVSSRRPRARGRIVERRLELVHRCRIPVRRHGASSMQSLDSPLLARGNAHWESSAGQRGQKQTWRRTMERYKGRRDAVRFLDEWAPDLGGLLLMGWPMLRFAGPRMINDVPGLLLTAPRNHAARFDAPLNAFLALSSEGLGAFFRDDLLGYARFNASVGWLATYCLRYDVDLAGGSQQGPRTRIVPLDPIFDATLDPARAAAVAAPSGEAKAGTSPDSAYRRTDETSGNAI